MGVIRLAVQWLAASSLLAALQIGPVYSLQVPGSSMEPTIAKGSWLEVEAANPLLVQSLERGDIVVFRAPVEGGQMLLKRIVGLMGDEIEIRDKRLLRNGTFVVEPFAQFVDPQVFAAGTGPAGRDQMPPAIVPEAAIFVLGDNRDQSYDSRFFGAVGLDRVAGRVR